MKARVKATHEILEVRVDGFDADYRAENGKLYWEKELDFNIPDEPDYWEKLLHQYAGMAMQGLLSNHIFFKDVDRVTSGKPQDLTADIAEQFATALVKKLKSESNA